MIGMFLPSNWNAGAGDHAAWRAALAAACGACDRCACLGFSWFGADLRFGASHFSVKDVVFGTIARLTGEG
ncbi:MAG TPA: hypothetical protein PLS67_13620, partial [Accumulibacter sp.]|nr:hypothetical protein [Accumulibacter sp.]